MTAWVREEGEPMASDDAEPEDENEAEMTPKRRRAHRRGPRGGAAR